MTKEQRILNYRLSRAHRMVENKFGILAHWFRCPPTTTQQQMQQHLHGAESIVLVCCVTHNLLAVRYPRQAARIIDIEDPNINDMLHGNTV